MYMKYAETQAWKAKIINLSESEMGGYKEIFFEIKGESVYSKMKYEAGVHRVQRVPLTEASGRVHTSTATVAVMPEVTSVEIKIDPNDVDMLQDLVLAAVNDGLKKAKAMMEAEMGQLTGGIKMPGLF